MQGAVMMACGQVYYPYSQWLKARYGQKVYKIPVNLAGTCPNRDGTLGTGGCIFCGACGGSAESLSGIMPVREQIEKNKAYMGSRYHAGRFIPFLQNFTNTYMDLASFKSIVGACAESADVVGVAISTRPDCVTDAQLAFLEELQGQRGLDVCVELGLQTANYKTLARLGRQHGLGDYVDAARRIKDHGLQLCTHTILNLPWDDLVDVAETAAIVSGAGSDFVKCHSLYIERGTRLADSYEKGEIRLLDAEAYIERAILFLSHLAPDVAVQRIIGRAPASDTVVANWHTSWWKIRDTLIQRMMEQDICQGKAYLAKRALLETAMA